MILFLLSSSLNRDSVLSDEEVQELGELGVVSVLAFEMLERGDTGSYTCTATNSLPGGQTGTQMAESPPIPLTVLGTPTQHSLSILVFLALVMFTDATAQSC